MERNTDVHVREQGTIKVSYTTGLILGAIIFLSSLFSGWITQSTEIKTVAAEQKGMLTRIDINSNRLTILEQSIMQTKQDLAELKMDSREINRNVVEIAKRLEAHDAESRALAKKAKEVDGRSK